MRVNRSKRQDDPRKDNFDKKVNSFRDLAHFSQYVTVSWQSISLEGISMLSRRLIPYEQHDHQGLVLGKPEDLFSVLVTDSRPEGSLRR